MGIEPPFIFALPLFPPLPTLAFFMANTKSFILAFFIALGTEAFYLSCFLLFHVKNRVRGTLIC